MFAPTKVTPMTTSDVSSAVDVLYQQKTSLSINRVMWKTWPDEIAQKARIRSAVEESMNSSSAKCLKVVENETENILGVLVLTRRKPSISQETKKSQESGQEEIKPMAPAELDSEVLKVVVAALDTISEKVAGIDHIEITALVVTPSLRKKGFGGQLMEVAFETARIDEVPLVVCSEPESDEFFVKLGFQEVKHYDMDLSLFAPPFSGFGPFRFTKMLWSVR